MSGRRTKQQSPAKPGSSPPKLERDAIIFLPGLGMAAGEQSVDAICRRLTFALDRNAASGKPQFLTKEGKHEDFGGYETRVISIVRKDQDEQPVADVYGLDYRNALLGHLQEKRPISHLVSTALVLLANTRRLLFARHKHGKSDTEKWQVRFAWLLYVILFLYLIIIFVAAATAFLDAAATTESGSSAPTEAVLTPTGPDAATAAVPVQRAQDRTAEESPSSALDDESAVAIQQVTERLRSWAVSLLNAFPGWGWMQMLVIWLTALGLFTRIDIKAWIENTGIEVTAADNYLTLDQRRGILQGQFAALLNHIDEKTDVTYRNVHVLSYSFGTIVALDSLYPYNQPGPRFNRIHTLVTIGCPFDFIRTYWPRYFQNRERLEGRPKNWINVFARADVLASDFLDATSRPMLEIMKGKKTAEPSQPTAHGIHTIQGEEVIPPTNLCFGRDKRLEDYSRLERVRLVGFRAHNTYWEGAEGRDVNCLDLVVPVLYKDDPILS